MTNIDKIRERLQEVLKEEPERLQMMEEALSCPPEILREHLTEILHIMKGGR